MRSGDIFIGAVFKTRSFGDVVVEQYTNSTTILVRFADGNTKTVAAKELRNGSIKNDFAPHVCGVGFVGVGEYKCTEMEEGRKKNTAAYEVWRGIIRRCYDKKWQQSKRPTYADCVVHKDWHNFQNFAKWFYAHRTDPDYHLDKDLAVFGNKVYGPDTCYFIPAEVNGLFSGHSAGSKHPRGVHFCNTKKKFIVQCHTGSRQDYFGHFDSLNEATLAYRVAKEKRVKEVAEKYKDVLPEVIYDNLTNYVVTI